MDFSEERRMFTINNATPADLEEILKVDRYMPREEMLRKIETRPEQVLVMKEDGKVVGVLRWLLFWDYIPYTCFLSVSESCRGKGYAKKALCFWEKRMAEEGWPMLMVSIPSDDAAQHFYRKQGYKDAGCMTFNEGAYQQASELFFSKSIEAKKPLRVGEIYNKTV